MNANPVFSLHIPTRILFGCGEIKKLATERPKSYLVKRL